MDEEDYIFEIDKNGKRILLAFVILFLGLFLYSFLKFVVFKSFQITAELPCDVTTEACYHYEPEPLVCEPDDTKCQEQALIPDEPYEYKIISKRAGVIDACQKTEAKIGCSEEGLSCLPGEKHCSIIFCDPNNLMEGQACYEPPTETETEVTDMVTEPTDTEPATSSEPTI
jgi:hypothetical protein